MSPQELPKQQAPPQQDYPLSELSSTVPSSDIPLPSSPSPMKRDIAEQHNRSEPSAQYPANHPPNPRLAALAAKQASLEAQLADLQAQRASMISEAKLPSGLDMPADWTEEQKRKQALEGANSIIKEHIALLHRYNEMKDIGQGLMGLIADKRGVRVAAVMEEFGMSEKD